MCVRELHGHTATDRGQLGLGLFRGNTVRQAPKDHRSPNLPLFVGEHIHPQRQPQLVSERKKEFLRHDADHGAQDSPNPDGATHDIGVAPEA